MFPDRFGELAAPFPAQSPARQHELVPAHPAQKTVVWLESGQLLGHLRQQAVPSGVSEGVIDVAELVAVNVKQRQALSLVVCPVDLFVEAVL